MLHALGTQLSSQPFHGYNLWVFVTGRLVVGNLWVFVKGLIKAYRSGVCVWGLELFVQEQE